MDATARTIAFVRCRVGPADIALANVSGQLIFSGTQLVGQSQTALHADGLTVTGGVFCNEGFRSTGTIRLPGAHIEGLLDLSGAHLDGKGGSALHADGLAVNGDFFAVRDSVP